MWSSDATRNGMTDDVTLGGRITARSVGEDQGRPDAPQSSEECLPFVSEHVHVIGRNCQRVFLATGIVRSVTPYAAKAAAGVTQTTFC